MDKSKEYTGFAQYGAVGEWVGGYCCGIIRETNSGQVVVPDLNFSSELKNNLHIKGFVYCLSGLWDREKWWWHDYI